MQVCNPSLCQRAVERRAAYPRFHRRSPLTPSTRSDAVRSGPIRSDPALLHPCDLRGRAGQRRAGQPLRETWGSSGSYSLHISPSPPRNAPHRTVGSDVHASGCEVSPFLRQSPSLTLPRGEKRKSYSCINEYAYFASIDVLYPIIFYYTL